MSSVPAVHVRPTWTGPLPAVAVGVPGAVGTVESAGSAPAGRRARTWPALTALALGTAARVPVAPVAVSAWSATSREVFVVPVVTATSACSVMPDAGVKVAWVAVPNAPTSRSVAPVVVTEGAITLLFLAFD